LSSDDLNSQPPEYKTKVLTLCYNNLKYSWSSNTLNIREITKFAHSKQKFIEIDTSFLWNFKLFLNFLKIWSNVPWGQRKILRASRSKKCSLQKNYVKNLNFVKKNFGHPYFCIPKKINRLFWINPKTEAFIDIF
jgi:hypothetical protein